MPDPLQQPQHRRSTLDFGGASTGDNTVRGAAGRDIHQSGADPVEVFDMLKYMLEDQLRREVRQHELDRQFEQLRKDIADISQHVNDKVDLYRIATVQRLDSVDRSMRRLTYLYILLIAAWFLGLVVLVWLVIDQAMALVAIRVLLGAATASAAAWKMSGIR